MNKKLKNIVLIIAVIAVAVSCYATVAAFTAQKTVKNVITAGNIKIELKEMTIKEGEDAPVPFEDGFAVLPGAQISKIVTVKNTGKNAAYVRIKAVNTVSVMTDDGLEIDEELTAAVNELVTLDINTADWTYKDDGYYYYNKVLQAEEETTSLFTKADISTTMPNEYQGTTLKLGITVYAVQAANNGESVFDAAGWPN